MKNCPRNSDNTLASFNVSIFLLTKIINIFCVIFPAALCDSSVNVILSVVFCSVSKHSQIPLATHGTSALQGGYYYIYHVDLVLIWNWTVLQELRLWECVFNEKEREKQRRSCLQDEADLSLTVWFGRHIISTHLHWQIDILLHLSRLKQNKNILLKINLWLSSVSFVFLFTFEYKTTFCFPFFSFSFVYLPGSKHSFEIIVLFTVCVYHIFFGSVPSETCPVNHQNFQIEMHDVTPFFHSDIFRTSIFQYIKEIKEKRRRRESCWWQRWSSVSVRQRRQ